MTTIKTINWVAVTSLLIVGTALGLIVGMFTGGAATPSQLGDVGEVLRWGTPAFRSINNIAQAITIGSLIFVAFSLGEKSKAFAKTLSVAAISASVWALSGTAYLLATFLNVTGSELSAETSFTEQLFVFITDIELGQMLALNFAGAFVLSIATLLVRKLFGAAVCAAIGLLSLVPVALSGHAAGTASHAMAVNSLGLHLVGISIWLGGLVAIVFAYKAQPAIDMVKRYSSLALAGFGLVIVSGFASAQIRIGTIENLFGTGYGQLVILKTITFILLGVIGAMHRKKLLATLESSAKKFWQLVSVEFVIFGIAIGLGTALARTENPISDLPGQQLTPAEILTGAKLPPEPTMWTWATTFKPDILWILITAALAGFYLVGVWRLKQRGDSWSWARTASWLAGIGLLAYITNGYFAAYEQYLFSAHMLAHMLLAMGVPVLLVPGAPVTLLARAVSKRQDDSRGVREWILWAIHTKYAQFISHPLVAATMFASSLVIFYFTPIFGWATREHIGHQWMIVHFVITGYLFVQAIIGIDPGPSRFGYPQRLMLLIGTLAFHAFFGLAVMNSTTLLLADWFGAMGRTWGEDPLTDQQTGGGIAWGLGELPTAAITLIVAIQWARSDERDAKRLDRASDRGGNEDLAEYNRMLDALSKRKQEPRN
jgi:putative copper resistance protein D